MQPNTSILHRTIYAIRFGLFVVVAAAAAAAEAASASAAAAAAAAAVTVVHFTARYVA